MDFLPTKGIEYLLVIGYLLMLIPFWFVLQGGRRPARAHAALAGKAAALAAPAQAGLEGLRRWFRVPEGVHYHQGHTWAVPEGSGVFRVGLDDFAQRLVGAPDELRLPPVGARLEQGEKGWSLGVDGRSVSLLSPVRGEVLELNREAVENPSVLTEDPYGRGWLMRVKSPQPQTTLNNLMPWRVATAWMEDAGQKLSNAMSPQLGQVLQDGGVPVSGLARQIDPEYWDRLAAELLLTDER